jgi:hypothetical protein
VLAQAVAPGLVACLAAAANRWVMPEPRGVGPRRVPGRNSRGVLSDAVTTLSDRAAARNNETAPGSPIVEGERR